MNKKSTKLIALGLLLACTGLVLMGQPFYTWAREQNADHPCAVSIDPDKGLFQLENMNPGDVYTETMKVTKTGESSANLYLTWDPVWGKPEPGEPYSLFEWLLLTISLDGAELYSGLMSEGPVAGDPVVAGDALFVGLLEHNETIELEFKVTMPGPETTNDYQEATLETKVVFYTTCTGNGPPPPPPPPPGPDPDDPDDPDDPEDPGTPDETIIAPEAPELIPADPPDPDGPVDEIVVDPEAPETIPEDPEEIITIAPERPTVTVPLPRTDGVSIAFFVSGLAMIVSGVILKNRSGR